ncbi:hypothetical protein M446_2762 [Methylobacterium sp. 4-46]|nr:MULTISPECIES: hypothetical protein [Methylobacterium]ACA17200.1 hypothetical protein M446_2762 [Methylobacterium sp. 4-46]WFT82882.1 hypothetical protein QA634_13995 [Methylobacterium nodulans]
MDSDTFRDRSGRTLDDADQLSSVILLGLAVAGGAVAVAVLTFLA